MEFLTVQEAAEMLKVNDETIRRKIKGGQLKAYKMGKGYKIDREDLEEFIKTFYGKKFIKDVKK